jgi:uncharacterized protein
VAELPPTAAWCHIDAREGFEVVFVRRERGLYELDGYSTAVQEGETWGIRYALMLDDRWVTRSAHVVAQTFSGVHEVRLERNGDGVWRVDGAEAPQLSGCFDVDLEASACTNTVPVNRLGLGIGEAADAPAAFVRAPTPRVERLEQTYARLPNDGDRARYSYVAPAFDFRAILTYDRFGFVVDYPGLAVRVA